MNFSLGGIYQAGEMTSLQRIGDLGETEIQGHRKVCVLFLVCKSRTTNNIKGGNGGRQQELSCLVFGEGEDKIVVVRDGEFGGAIKGLLEAVDDVDFAGDLFEKAADAIDFDVEQQSAAFVAADGGQGIAEAFIGLEHKGHFAVSDHGPIELVLGVAGRVGGCVAGRGRRQGGDRHGERKTQELIDIERCADVFYKEIGGKRFHFFRINILNILV
jgi:hypothetical protein